MAEIKTEALILKTIPFKETSKIVRVYTRDKGKIAAIARGASRPKSDFRGKLDPLNYIEVIIYYKESRQVQTLGDIELLDSFLSDSRDLASVYYAVAILESLDKFIDGTEDNSEVFTLTSKTLQRVDKEPQFARLLLVYYLLQLADIMGYRINLVNCSICNKKLKKGFYNTSEDHLICAKCSYPNDMELSAQEIDFFRTIFNQTPESIKLTSFSDVDVTGAGKFLLKYLGWHMEVSPVLKSLKTLRDLKLES